VERDPVVREEISAALSLISNHKTTYESSDFF
jgi:hypothetical protein